MPKASDDGEEDGLPPADERVVLMLFVVGNSPQSTRAIARARAFCDEHLKANYELTVVDLYEQPELAEAEQIIAVPTLVKKLPPPIRRLIGDLSNTGRLLVALDLKGAGD